MGNELLTKKVAFIGLGVMGFPMAGHLSKAGHHVCVYNRTVEKAQKWEQEYNGEMVSTPMEAVQKSDFVFMCLGNDQDVRDVFYAEKGIFNGLKSETILIDHTTTSADLSLELHEACLKKRGYFLDAPVSGGQSGAEKGALTIMVGGDVDVYSRSESILTTYAQKIQWMGACGMGQRCKMVNQIMIAGVLQGLSEGIIFAQKVGLDIEQVVETLKYGAAGSWQLENRAKTMSEGKYDFGFAIDWMRKDLLIALNEAKKIDVELPLASEVEKHYQILRKQGLGRCDSSVLIEYLRQSIEPS